MADLLVMMPDVVHHNPDLPGAYLPGMVVDVFEDDRNPPIGPGVNQHPKFFVVRIPGVPAQDVVDLLDAITDYDIVTGEPVMLKRRAMKLDFNRLSRPIQRRIENEREIEVTQEQFRSFMASVLEQ